MKNKLFAALLLVLSCALFSNAQVEKSTDLPHLFPEPRTWDFGLSFFQGIEGIYKPNFYDQNSGYLDKDHYMNLSFYATYQISDRSSVRSEIAFGGSERLAPSVNFQYSYRFSKRWSVYSGIALEFEPRSNNFYQLGYDPKYRRMIPRAMVGVRYQANKNLFIDLRYQHDLMNRTVKQNLPTSVGRIGTLGIGIGIKF